MLGILSIGHRIAANVSLGVLRFSLSPNHFLHRYGTKIKIDIRRFFIAGQGWQNGKWCALELVELVLDLLYLQRRLPHPFSSKSAIGFDLKPFKSTDSVRWHCVSRRYRYFLRRYSKNISVSTRQFHLSDDLVENLNVRAIERVEPVVIWTSPTISMFRHENNTFTIKQHVNVSFLEPTFFEFAECILKAVFALARSWLYFREWAVLYSESYSLRLGYTYSLPSRCHRCFAHWCKLQNWFSGNQATVELCHKKYMKMVGNVSWFRRSSEDSKISSAVLLHSGTSENDHTAWLRFRITTECVPTIQDSSWIDDCTQQEVPILFAHPPRNWRKDK